MSKKFEELDFTDNFFFCKILMKNKSLCIELLELILKIKIKDIIFMTEQKPIEITVDARGVRLDVYVEDEANTVYDIEMQPTMTANLPKRSRYYQGMIDLNLIERGGDFNELKRVMLFLSAWKTRLKKVCISTPLKTNVESVRPWCSVTTPQRYLLMQPVQLTTFHPR